jgi:hypothetical protein
MFLEPSLIARSISKKERDKKPKNIVSLEKPSLAMTAQFIIEAT